MTDLMRRWRARINDAQANRLRGQLAAERARARALEQRVADLQAANEGATHELSIARGAGCLTAYCPWCPPKKEKDA
jgi:hypothetical protein